MTSGDTAGARPSHPYLIAVLVTGLALIAAIVLDAEGARTLAPLVGAVAVSCWIGGAKPGLVSCAVGFTVAWYALAHPDDSWSIPSGSEFARWVVPLCVSLVVVWASWALRRVGVEATSQARLAVRQRTATESVQRLTSELSRALTPSDVAHALVERVPTLLGATGGALGLIDGDALQIVDPEGVPQQTLRPGLRLSLQTRAPITTAARTGSVVFVDTRAAFEREFPDGVRLAPHAHAALAVPLRVGGAVVGSMGFPFGEADTIDDDVIAVAVLAADLGGQALERAGLYEQERDSRAALDRISRLAPRFGSESPETVARTVCIEAADTFGADVAQVWLVAGDVFEVLWRNPESDVIPPGTRVRAADFPGLAESVERLEPMFIEDSLANISGEALEHARHFGIRSSLRIPIASGGRADRVLVLQWTTVLPAPSQSTIALARRFADQAGLALEHAERRVAQADAARNADETQRLLDLTAALSAALEPRAVADATLVEAVRSFGAAGGVVARLRDDDQLDVQSVSGRVDDAVGDRHSLAAGTALARAARSSDQIVVDETVMAFPLVAVGRVVGALALTFDAPQRFTTADREFALALSRQSGQALERTALYETEHEARTRAERMAGDLAQLHALATALGRAAVANEVTRIIGDQMTGSIGADTAGIYLLDAERERLQLVSVTGRLDESDLTEFADLAIQRASPITETVREARAIWLVTDAEWSEQPRAAPWRTAGISAVGIVPLVVEETAIGALFVLFGDGRRPTDEDRRFTETVARQAAQPLERVRLLEDERSSRLRAERATDQLRRLQAVTESLAGAPTVPAVADVMLREGRAVLDADGALVHLHQRDSADLTLLDAVGAPADLIAPASRLPADVSAALTEAYASGTVVEVTRPDPGSAADPGRRVFRTMLCIPLTVSGEAIGVMTVGFEHVRRFDAEDRRTASAMGRQCAQALDRSRLFDEERDARDRSERLQALTTALSRALTPAEVIAIYVRQVGPAVGARSVAIGVVEREGLPPARDHWHGDASDLPAHWLEARPELRTPVDVALGDEHPRYYDSAAGSPGAGPAGGDRSRERAHAVIPLLVRRRCVGVAVLFWERGLALDLQDRSFLEACSSLCAQALDRARRYETERTIAETLQRSVLPETLPSTEGAVVAARYLPGTEAVDVGGDWFDTLLLADGRLGFAVGDVVGKGVEAAATMAQLRNGMRAIALDTSDPGAIVTKLNRLLPGYAETSFATLAFIAIDPSTREATMVSAGHPPPVVVGADDVAVLLDQARGLPLGVDPDVVYEPWTTTLDAGATLVLYTDGLVERRDRSLDDGLRLLCETASGGLREPEELIDVVLDALLGDAARGDDVAVLAVALDRAPLGPFEARLPADRASLRELRESFAGWLDRGGIPENDRRDLILATWEATANAVEHPASPAEPVIDVRASLSGDTVRVEVCDHGSWTEPRGAPDRGLGLHLIQTLMTTMTVRPGPDGTRLVMERVLSRERVGENEGNGSDNRRS